jgi:hypothetical protein
METIRPRSHSPQMSNRASPPPQALVPAPVTPLHSPHHSLSSSVSSRTPIHNLSIHEYRKQQHTPIPRTATPSGKTLRRKAAVPALNGAERAPSITQTTQPGSQSSLRALHASHSAQHLVPRTSPSQQHLLSDQLFRSQSAEPRTQGGSISSISTTNSLGQVRVFNSRKRLPKPPAANRSGPLPPLAIVTYLPPPPTDPSALDFSGEASCSSRTRDTPTASTFSLSRFPKPPHLSKPSFSPPQDEQERTRINTFSYATTAPATPPATPAVLHYRGASFDLVNPHDSLLLHDIVTPSRDFGSSEYLPVRSSEYLFEDSSEVVLSNQSSLTPTEHGQMAPKRALYGDISSAHAGILRRPDDSFGNFGHDLPLPPTPAAVSPESSAYTSPLYSPESNFAPPPLAVKKSPSDSRFSIKQLTRSLTKKLGKTPEQHHEQELQDLRDSRVSLASASMGREMPHAFDETHVAVPAATYFPVNPMSPITPTSPVSPQELGFADDEDYDIEVSRQHSMQRYDSEPLTSMVPEDPSAQIGRCNDPRESMSEGYLQSRPYYDDLESIYASSSIYTGDDHRKSAYQQSLASNRQSNPFVRYSGMDASNFANEYNQDSPYGYTSRTHRKSKPLSQEMYHRSMTRGNDKTDTISKIIEQYDPNPSADTTMSYHSQQPTGYGGLVTSASETFDRSHPMDRPALVGVPSGLSQFEMDPQQDPKQVGDDDEVLPKQQVLARKPTTTRHIGAPPREPAPLAPSFEYDEAPYASPRPDASEVLSNKSSYSYGDTRHLLQISQVDGLVPPVSALVQSLQPSSSYSQATVRAPEPSSSYSQMGEVPSPQTPREALDQADRIFEHAITERQQHRHESIPAIWARRSSGSLLVSKRLSNYPAEEVPTFEIACNDDQGPVENDGDWESVQCDSREARVSLGSIADYSSSEGTRNSLGINSDGSLPSWSRNPSQGVSVYSHQSPVQTHQHPFSSSPPQLPLQARVRTTSQISNPRFVSSPPRSNGGPGFSMSTHPEDVFGRGAVEEPYAFAPWADQYAFSDKETQELLASGPNDKIMMDNERASTHQPYQTDFQHTDDYDVVPASSSPVSAFGNAGRLERENTFEKLCIIGPKGNLTGTPQGTGMHETGSSVADFSSPGFILTSSTGHRSYRSADHHGFYASPFPATGSVTRIRQSQPPARYDEEQRSPSEMTLFPKTSTLEPVSESPSGAGTKHRSSLRGSTSFLRSQRRVSRSAAVPGQTKLRQMILAPEHARKALSSQDTTFSRSIGGSIRPSTSDTTTPLRPYLSVNTLPPVRTVIAHHHSPHLLCPERVASPEDEERRRKLSWAILAVFCLLPPCIILYRLWGDSIIVSVTKGQLGHCTPRSKKAALIGGIAVNIGIATAIVTAIGIAHALGAA